MADTVEDTHECETCGVSYATGYIVWKDDEMWFTLHPHAHCFDGADYNEEDLMREILKRLGHEFLPIAY